MNSFTVHTAEDHLWTAPHYRSPFINSSTLLKSIFDQLHIAEVHLWTAPHYRSPFINSSTLPQSIDEQLHIAEVHLWTAPLHWNPFLNSSSLLKSIYEHLSIAPHCWGPFVNSSSLLKFIYEHLSVAPHCWNPFVNSSTLLKCWSSCLKSKCTSKWPKSVCKQLHTAKSFYEQLCGSVQLYIAEIHLWTALQSTLLKYVYEYLWTLQLHRRMVSTTLLKPLSEESTLVKPRPNGQLRYIVVHRQIANPSWILRKEQLHHYEVCV